MPRFPHYSSTVADIRGSIFSSLAHRMASYQGEVYPLHVGDTWLEPAIGCRMEDLRVEDYPGMHRYSRPQGLPELLEALAERLAGRTLVPTARQNLLVATGATGALGAVAGAILEPGDEVLILAPHWPLIAGIVRSFHGRYRRSVSDEAHSGSLPQYTQQPDRNGVAPELDCGPGTVVQSE